MPLTNLIAAANLLAACGAQAVAAPAPAAPRRYDGACVLAGIDAVPAPVAQGEDSVVMVARYRPSDSDHPGSKEWSLRFQVQRAREHDLRLHLEAHPTVLCDVDRDATQAVPARIDVPPFQGQPGAVGR